MLQHVMHKYDEMLDELMGAQNYTKESKRAESEEDRTMYASMARQEVNHADFLMKSLDRKISEHDEENSKIAWHALRMHVCEWKSRILKELEENEGR